jgi:hypothetical protein
MDALQNGMVLSLRSCDVMKSKVPLESTAPPRTNMNVQMYARSLMILRDVWMQDWSAIDPLMITGGLFVNTSHSLVACTGCCLQDRVASLTH